MPETLNHSDFCLLCMAYKKKQNPACERSFSLMTRNHKFFSIAVRIGQEELLLISKVAIHSNIVLKTF